METLREKTLVFFNKSYGDGYGDGDGYGSGYGDGDGDGSGSGSGYGDGSGYGYGSGYGDGSGSGDGYGYGDGDGDGYGDGDGDGDGIKSFNGQTVWIVDGMQTIINEVHGNVAKGFILESDFALQPCFIVKQDNLFAHGETLHDAHESILNKLFEKYPENVRLAKFKEAYPDFNVKIPAKELFEWHNRLTGSCLMGRQSFARDKGIDVATESFTVYEFVELTKNAYGGQTIRKILES